MSELEKIEPRSRPRRATIGTKSRRPTGAPLERLYSGQHLDDHSYYHHNDHDQNSEDDGLNTLAIEEKREGRNKDDGPAERKGPGSVPELRNGVPGERDLEDGPLSLAKQTTTRSVVKPENLVSTSFFYALFRANSRMVDNMGQS